MAQNIQDDEERRRTVIELADRQLIRSEGSWLKSGTAGLNMAGNTAASLRGLGMLFGALVAVAGAIGLLAASIAKSR